MVPVGTKVTLQKGEQAHITQSLGGSYTVIVNGNMFRIDGKDADALGLEVKSAPATAVSGPVTQEQLKSKSGRRSRPVTTRKFPSTSWTSA